MAKYCFLSAMLACALFLPRPAAAQTDEIQVYDAGIAPVGVFNLTLHNNFTPDGIAIPAFAGAVTANHSWNGVPEWAYGVTPWFEAGLYMPLYSDDRATGFGLNGFKLRTLFVSPHAADRRFFYGVNFEFSVNANRWDTSRYTSEVRPIFGWHLKPWDIVINPIVDTKYKGGLSNLEFVPATRLAYNFSPTWAMAVEEYDDFGPLHQFVPTNTQFHETWLVADHPIKGVSVEAGVGYGLTNSSDRVTLKLILSRDLNKPKN